jgi:hypothetical protein
MTYDEWQRKQDRLRDFLRSHGAEDAPYRVDLSERKIFWVDPLGLSLAVADCKVLLSYALSNRSVMMAWANSSLAADCGIPEIDGFDPYYADCEPEDVWSLATDAGSAVQAEALYRAPSPQSWVMLGLWNLRSGGSEQFYSGSPKSHVLTVLGRLMDHPYPDELAVLLDNYSESFLQMAGHPHKSTDFEKELQDTARSMRNLLGLATDEGMEDLRAELERLAAHWETLP